MQTRILIVAASLALAASLGANASEELAKKSGCLNCHNVTGAKKMGASLKDLAPKVKGNEAAVVEKLSSGKGHPAQKASADDLKAIVAWIAAM
jgi:cytochrome c